MKPQSNLKRNEYQKNSQALILYVTNFKSVKIFTNVKNVKLKLIE